jgi:lysophospholipase L1-like esterase
MRQGGSVRVRSFITSWRGGLRGRAASLLVLALAACSSSDEPPDSALPMLAPEASAAGAGSNAAGTGGANATGTTPPVTGAGADGTSTAEGPPPGTELIGGGDIGGGATGEATGDGGAPASGAGRWVGAWATGPQLTEPANLPPAPGLAGNTLRQNVFTTLSGSRLRVLFSNEWGEAPVTFEGVSVAASAGASAIARGSEEPLLFGGSASVTLAPGQTRVSDPLDHDVQALSSLALSIRFGAAPANVTGHPGSRTTSFLASGDAAFAPDLPGAATADHWYFITGVDVERPEPSAAIVTLGDSITDGRGSTTNANDRWPDGLARRLQADPAMSHIAVLNQGIGGNAVVSGGLGPTAIDRFQRDVLDQRAARWVIVLEGVNDIGGASDATVATRLIDAYQRLIASAHTRGLLVYGVPILPFAGSSYDSPVHEEARQTVNTWVRTSGQFDAVIDLDTAVADPANPAQLLAAYDTGDHLHLNPAGYQAMANAIDLNLFQP